LEKQKEGRLQEGEGEGEGEGKGFLTTENFDTMFRIIRRLNLLVNQPFIYIYIYEAIYNNNNNGGYNTRI